MPACDQNLRRFANPAIRRGEQYLVKSIVAYGGREEYRMSELTRPASTYNENQRMQPLKSQTSDRWDSALKEISKQMHSCKWMTRFGLYDYPFSNLPRTRLQRIVADVRTAVRIRRGMFFWKDLLKQIKLIEGKIVEENSKHERS